MDKIKNTAVWISVVIGAFMAIYGAYSLFTKKIIEKDRQQQSAITLRNEVKDNNKPDSLIISRFSELNFRFNNLSDTLKKIVEKQNLIISKQVKTDKGLVELYKLTGKVEALVNWWMP
jgi:hypothetical protein